ncbi:MAG: hypothetical protein R3F56_13050 [Planctomycetota bacterium]
MIGRRLAMLLGLSVSACVPLPPAAVNSSLQPTEALQDVKPSNVAVVPVEDATAGGNAREVLETIRQEICAALVQRRYAPLSSRVVDPIVREQTAGVANASMTRPDVLARVAGHLNEDAVLAIRITMWDESRIMASARVRFAAEATMLSSTKKTVLWGGTLDGEIKAGQTAAAPRYRDERVLDVAKQIARALISQLPERS